MKLNFGWNKKISKLVLLKLSLSRFPSLSLSWLQNFSFFSLSFLSSLGQSLKWLWKCRNFPFLSFLYSPSRLYCFCVVCRFFSVCVCLCLWLSYLIVCLYVCMLAKWFSKPLGWLLCACIHPFLFPFVVACMRVLFVYIYIIFNLSVIILSIMSYI